MKRKKTFYVVAAGLLLCSMALTACSSNSIDGGAESASDAAGTSEFTVLGMQGVDPADMFTDRDMDSSYDLSSAGVITLTGSGAESSTDAAAVSGGVITITEEGTYILSGTLDDGMVIVDAESTDKVQLVLNGANIRSSSSAAIYVKQADKVFITLADGSENRLENGGAYENIDDNNIDAVVFSKDDLTFNGSGTLAIDGSDAGHGVVSKDDLVVTGGSYTVDAASHGLSGKDSVRIADGFFVIVSGKDGVHAEDDENTESGFLYVAGGTFDVESQGDGLSGEVFTQIDDGSFHILSGGGAGNAAQIESEDVSAKAVKATGGLYLNGGSFTIDAADDALHANGDLAVNGGDYQLSSGDDGAHADATLYISGGDVTVSDSYEALEGLDIEILGGTMDLTASDDGLNAAGGNDQSGFGGHGGRHDMFDGEGVGSIVISGGVLHVDAQGDGIDSNGTLTVSGGETYVSGPTNSGNGALDYQTSGNVSGGIFVATGPSGMAMSFGSDSTQGVISMSFETQAAGNDVVLTDSSGDILIEWTSPKTFSHVVLSHPDLTVGGSYTLAAGTYSVEITLDTLVYGNTGGMFGGGMGGNGGMGGGQTRPDAVDGAQELPANGELPEMPANGEMPEMPTGSEVPDGNGSGMRPGGRGGEMPTDNPTQEDSESSDTNE